MTSGRVRHEDVGAALEVGAAVVVGGELQRLEVGAGGAVEDDDAVADDIEEGGTWHPARIPRGLLRSETAFLGSIQGRTATAPVLPPFHLPFCDAERTLEPSFGITGRCLEPENDDRIAYQRGDQGAVRNRRDSHWSR